MDFDNIIKAIANPMRRQMLAWLKDPVAHFGPNEHHDCCGGVCVGKIVEKSQLSQSTVSAYMDCLQRAGLVVSMRRGQWTFYKRNEPVIAEFVAAIGAEL
ncbi:MAG TPA: helix-turn-helix transcriptional regulator [Capsulimonadaceae bacterium]